MRIKFELFPGLGGGIGYADDKLVILFLCFVIILDFGHFDFV